MSVTENENKPLSEISEELKAKIDKYVSGEELLAFPEWEPYAKVDESRKSKFMLGLMLLAGCFTPELGQWTVKFENCDPEREFIIKSDEVPNG